MQTKCFPSALRKVSLTHCSILIRRGEGVDSVVVDPTLSREAYYLPNAYAASPSPRSTLCLEHNDR